MLLILFVRFNWSVLEVTDYIWIIHIMIIYIFIFNIIMICTTYTIFNKFKPEQNGSHFVDDMFQYVFLKENFHILIEF